jgi:hypothetical protein
MLTWEIWRHGPRAYHRQGLQGDHLDSLLPQVAKPFAIAGEQGL